MRANFDLRGVGLHILKVCASASAGLGRRGRQGRQDGKRKTGPQARRHLPPFPAARQGRGDLQAAAGRRFLAGPAGQGAGKLLPDAVGRHLFQSKRTATRRLNTTSGSIRRTLPAFPGRPAAIVRLAVLEYNTSHDPHRSIPHYQHVLKKYPKHPQAEQALYFLALDAVQAGDKRLAESSCKDFIKRYPKSGWRNHIQSVLSDEVPKLKDKSEGEKR